MRVSIAEQMGNTFEVIKNHYQRAIPRNEAESFWNLRPSMGEKIIRFAKG